MITGSRRAAGEADAASPVIVVINPKAYVATSTTNLPWVVMHMYVCAVGRGRAYEQKVREKGEVRGGAD